MVIKKIQGIPDYAEIIDLINLAWPAEYRDTPDKEKIAAFTGHHNSRTDTVKYLYDNNRIIGFYRYSPWPREDAKTKTAHCFDIAVLEECQKKGLGTLLLNDMIEECRERGFTKILSCSFRSNEGPFRPTRYMFTYFFDKDGELSKIPLQ